MKRVTRVALMAASVVIGYGSAAQADIIFCPESSGTAACDPVNGETGNPPENLLFNDEDAGVVLGPAVTVTGRTNQTDTLIDITDLDGEDLAVQTSGGGSGGQAKVTGADDSFSNILLSAHDPDVGFTEFEANLLVVEGSGTVTVTVTNQFGATEVGTYEVDENGQNFFNLLAFNDQLIKTIEIEAEAGLLLSFIEQIRLGGISEPPTGGGAEPAALLLFGTALVAGGRRLRRRLSTPMTV